MKTLLFIFGLLITPAVATDRPDVIRPKMSFEAASALLEKHHAKPTTLQVVYPDEKQNLRIEHFTLTDTRVIELALTRKKEDAPWTIKTLSEVVWIQPAANRGKEWRPLKELALGESPEPLSPRLQSSIGKQVTLSGIAEPRKSGAALQGKDFYVWLKEVHYWPDGTAGRKVEVKGRLEEDHGLPVFINDPSQLPLQGIPVPPGINLKEASRRLVIVDATWKVIE